MFSVQLQKDLRPCLLLDHLRHAGIINTEQYRELQESIDTEAARSRKLLYEVLSLTQQGTLQKFLGVLLTVEGQEHIVPDIQRQIRARVEGAGDEVKVMVADERTVTSERRPLQPLGGPGDHGIGHHGIGHKQFSEKGIYNPATALEAGRPIGLSLAATSTPSSLPEHRPQLELDPDKGATFYYRQKDLLLVQPVKHTFRLLCRRCFGIHSKLVKFVSDSDEECGSGYPFYGDLASKLAVLSVYGVDIDTVLNEKRRVINDIAAFMRVPQDKIEFLEPARKCVLLIFRLGLDVYLTLLSALGERERVKTLGRALRRTLPGLHKAHFRLGGLPPIEVFNSSSKDKYLKPSRKNVVPASVMSQPVVSDICMCWTAMYVTAG